MPELPEVESARAVIERAALDRPDRRRRRLRHLRVPAAAPGEIRAALVGRRLTAAHRRGKSMWCDTSGSAGRGPARCSASTSACPARSSSPTPDGTEIDGGDYWERGRRPGDYRFTRFALTFADGGALLLVDPRRLGRVRLDPPVDALGPDAAEITPGAVPGRVRAGTAPVKARLLDQDAIAGVGNLLADQVLWLAKINPAPPVGDLTRADVDRLLPRPCAARSRRPSPAAACTPCRSSRSGRPGGAVPALTAPRWCAAPSAAGPPGGAPREQV